jgi:hypothetical protein
MHRLHSTVVSGVVLAAVCLSAQTPTGQTPSTPPPPATAAIIGTVVDEGTGRPIAGVLIGWSPGPGTSFGTRREYPQILTGSDGRFMLTSLVAGQYSLNARRGGYLPATPGSPAGMSPFGAYIDVAEGQIRSDVKIEMARPGTIAGIVLDEAGEPVIGQQLQAARRIRSRGRTTWQPAGGSIESTDDRGAYRIGNLVPGDYIVLAEQSNVNLPTGMIDAYQKAQETVRPGQTNPMSDEMFAAGGSGLTPGTSNARLVNGQVQSLSRSSPATSDRTGKSVVYPTTFYPAATAASKGTVLTIHSGEERSSIDITLRPVPAVKISGTVAGQDGPAPFTAVTLTPGDTVESPFGQTRIGTATDATGAFTFLSVAAGEYTLRVTKIPTVQNSSNMVSNSITMADGSVSMMSSSSGPARLPPLPPDPTLWAEVAVSAGARDIAGLAITLQSGARLSGRVEFSGGLTKPTPQQISSLSFSASPVTPMRATRSPRTRIDDQGQLTTQGYPSGDYLVNVFGAPVGWMLESITSKGIDVTQRPLEIAGTDISDIVITFTDKVNELSGVVTGTNGSIPKTAVVVLFPSDEPLDHDYGTNPRRLIATRASSNGKFSFKGFPAGDYRLIAVDDASIQANLAADVVQPLVARSTSVRFAAGEKRQQNLTLVNVIK